MSGEDTITFLQGQLSQDIAALNVGSSAWTLLLEPNGKVTAWMRATRVGATAVTLDTDPGMGAAVVARLERFRMRTRCTFALSPDEVAVAVRAQGGDELAVPNGGLPIAWPGMSGYDLLGPSPVLPDGMVATADGYEVERIGRGIPVSGVDITAETIPAEAGAWLIEASVSFTKGCYTGQELVARVDSRGANVPRPLRRLLIDGNDVAPGAEVSTPEGKVVGHVTSAAWSASEGATVALAPLARSVAVPGPVVVGGVAATVR
ncbi:MAG: glycine cleavage T C-terminal barrel domain-containing protein [Acidimicrobiales bacterium]